MHIRRSLSLPYGIRTIRHRGRIHPRSHNWSVGRSLLAAVRSRGSGSGAVSGMLDSGRWRMLLPNSPRIRCRTAAMRMSRHFSGRGRSVRQADSPRQSPRPRRVQGYVEAPEVQAMVPLARIDSRCYKDNVLVLCCPRRLHCSSKSLQRPLGREPVRAVVSIRGDVIIRAAALGLRPCEISSPSFIPSPSVSARKMSAFS